MAISQRQARAYRKRMIEAESALKMQRNRWGSDWIPGWKNIECVKVGPETYARVATARLLEHAVIVTVGNQNELRLYADRLSPPI